MGYKLTTIYIGPMVVLEPLELVEEVEYTACLKTDCPAFEKNSKAKFCPQCGSAITAYVREKKSMASLYNFIYGGEVDNEHFENELYCSEYSPDTLIPNHHIAGMYTRWGDLEEKPIFLEHIEENREAHMAKFKERYEKILAALTEFGFDYTIKYGVKVQ